MGQVKRIEPSLGIRSLVVPATSGWQVTSNPSALSPRRGTVPTVTSTAFTVTVFRPDYMVLRFLP